MKRCLCFLLVAIALTASRSEALPVLQLDMRNGFYDSGTQTIEATGDTFTVYALLTLKPGMDVAGWLADTYYVTVALTPQVNTPSSLGSFQFAGTNVPVTDGMTYGTPPKDSIPGLGGQLGSNNVYPTYYREFAFQFSPLNQVLSYDSALRPGGPGALGSPDYADYQTYVATFTGDASLLAQGYDLHFDLYNTYVALCGRNYTPDCTNINVDQYAPFDHDAQTARANGIASMPEPASALCLLTGVTLAGFTRRRRQD